MKKRIPDPMNKAIKEFSTLLKKQLGPKLLDTRLFGSVARGTFTPESDIDILVIIQDENKITRDTIIETAVDINLKYDVVISPVIISAERFSRPLFQETYFYKSIQKEGIPL
ncbi:nucleotidyltransferase family protein [Neomoorella thermoacetica]|uniref:nucleotidyltransferase family protein n=1 Tax=Neomoorella thermoacetica TaxID=1525 RepID=UPI000916AEA3|nr:nucleotidyltransferase domain-containing protein [Moorella thermoacetica]OIQ12638.1 nucleotidyltransferase domain protein [Moorella thermoacetica]